ncbi:MAG: hypothetical protein CV087_22710 [Candidatus Brocadia sp. WS118]|nr:MAG: hypothetical protein CV087_22710 [Candidatus Brocadia sp. WS118]
MQNRKAIIIHPVFATVLSSIAISAILGGVGYAWNTNADMAVLQRDVKQIKDANLDVRLSVMEQNVRSVVDSINRVEANQTKANDKLDKLLERGVR